MWNKKRIDNMDFSMGLFVIYFKQKIYDKVAHHTIGWEKDMKGY